MSANNRHLRGNTKQVQGTVAGAISVEPGDLVGVNNTDGYYGNTVTTLNQANNYLYPILWARAVTTLTSFGKAIASTFVGVAMTGSAAGTTNEITVATDGIFRYPLVLAPSAVTIGSKISAVSGTQASGSSNQAVAANDDNDAAGSNGCTAYLGYIVKTESGASFVDFQLWSGIYDSELT